MDMDLLKLNGDERIVPFLRRNSINWDCLRGQLLDLTQGDQLFLKVWCQKIISLLEGSLLGMDIENRLLRLESEKDTLHLQVSVLSDQIEAQTLKINDLETMLDDTKNDIENTEEKSMKELVTRSGLETQKLELMTEISGLRLKQAELERENFELKNRFCMGAGSGSGISLTELNYSEGRFWDKPPVPVGRSRPLQSGPGQGLTVTDIALDDSCHRIHLGSERDRERERDRDRDQQQIWRNQRLRAQTPPSSSYRHVDHHISSFGTLPRRSQPNSRFSLSSPSGTLHNNVDNSTKCNSLSSSNIHTTSTSLSLNYSQMGGGNNGTGHGHGNQHTSNSDTAWLNDYKIDGVSSSVKKSEGSSRGSHKSRSILKILGKLKRSNSGGFDSIAPENNSNDIDVDLDFDNNGKQYAPTPFVRGGVRSTAAPRLGWMAEKTAEKMPDGPVSSWDCEAVIAWLNYLGLSTYTMEAKQWVKSGQQLLDASSEELEKELNVKNVLHRKKLNLAHHALKHPEEEDNAGKLDYHWVTRWLDDVGLPQYKVTFAEARIDGRMLNRLTSEDLLLLKVTSAMHHLSLKRGVQILRIHRFHPSCLCRRGSSAGLSMSIARRDLNDRGPLHVATWTNHRVMEWLKAVDLAEYAPNLRGSGVHGALVLFEPSFNAELLALLLSIPGNKTLLRRHLSLQFNDLIGRYIVQEKRLAEISDDYTPISPTLKVKALKKSQFPLRKKRLSSEFSDDEKLLCPTDWNSYPAAWEVVENNKVHSGNFEYDGPTSGGGSGSKVSNI